jgi:integrase/recombinase XerC
MTPKPHSLLDSFRDHLETSPLPSRIRQGAAENTVRGYVRDIEAFLRWWKQTEGGELTAASLHKDPFALNKKTLQDYLAFQERRQAAVGTILHKASSLRAFIHYLRGARIIEHDPTVGLRLPHKADPEPRGLSESERARFEAVFQQPWLDRAPKRKRASEVEQRVLETARARLARDRALAFLMLYAGPRVEEVVNLNLSDVEIRDKSGQLHIRKGKGARERRTSIPLPARKALAGWLKIRQVIHLSNDPASPLFVRLRGDQGERLTVRAIQGTMAEAGRRAQIKDAVTPHVLRHTCAFLLRQAGVGIEVRSKMLGHSIETAARYGAPGESEIERAASTLDHAEAA